MTNYIGLSFEEAQEKEKRDYIMTGNELDRQFMLLRDDSIFKPQMRLKYRAWHADDKCMIYDLNSPRLHNGEFEYDDYIIMPYTTICDKHGKEIYHSDIILVDEVERKMMGSERAYCLVGFHSGAFMYGRGEYPLFMNTYLWLTAHMKDAIEVVGNYYENYDLLGIDL